MTVTVLTSQLDDREFLRGRRDGITVRATDLKKALKRRRRTVDELEGPLTVHVPSADP